MSSKMPGQLSFEEFIYLFGKYDWKDIIDALEELDNTNDLYDQFDINISLITVIFHLKHTPMNSKWSNSYLSKWIS